MNKLKDLWENNRVLIVLGIILIICIIAILIVTVSFFLGGSKSVYGNRLDDIEKYPITETFKGDFIDNLESDEAVENVQMDVKGRVIYIAIDFVGDVPLVDAESKAAATIESFSEDILGYYDINFTLKSKDTDNSEGFLILGAKNVAGSGIVWNNNTPLESDEEE